MNSRLSLLVFMLVIFGSVSLALGDHALPVAADVDDNALAAPDESALNAALESAPLMFTQNVGQFDEAARFQVRGTQGSLWLTEDALWITVVEPMVDPEFKVRHEPTAPGTRECGRAAGDVLPARAAGGGRCVEAATRNWCFRTFRANDHAGLALSYESLIS